MVKAKKSLGQNFLRDPKILRKIADFAEIKKGDTVLEIGPGEGMLTKILLEKAGKVVAVEKDLELVKLLRGKFKIEIKNKKLKIIEGDILNYELRIKNYVLMGNIPYYITGEIFRKFLQNPPSGNQPASITFVVQKEVAERIMAKDSKESILSLSVKAYGTPKYGGIIKKGSFSPKPKVDSAIIAIKNISKKKFKQITPLTPPPETPFRRAGLTTRGEPDTEKMFFEVVKRGFRHKRKLLASNLGVLRRVLSTLGISENTRAEDLKIDDWFKLTSYIKSEQK
ncbi:MAG: 16S rRNA (adenine(1518)-N(6)/adenine(1519)-N(6))-dimethyltransferase RsmA [Patescibacteria group bacterium]